MVTTGIIGLPTIIFMKDPKPVLWYPTITRGDLFSTVKEPNTVEAANAADKNITIPINVAVCSHALAPSPNR